MFNLGKQLKRKRCRICKVFFIPAGSLQICCSPSCAIKKAQLDRVKSDDKKAKKARSEHRAAKEKAKPLAWFAGSAQTVFNKWVRMRDAEFPCISCGCGNIRYVGGQPKVTSWDCGHYMSRGSTPALKLEPLNCAKQCVACNQYNHGNLVNFRIELINRIGIDQVLWLEGPHQPKKYTVDDYKEIKRVYSAKIKELMK